MDNFSKIYSLFGDVYDELEALKTKLQNDASYSVQHAEIITLVESADEALREIETNIHDIENDVDVLNDNIESSQFKEEDEDEATRRIFNPDEDDD